MGTQVPGLVVKSDLSHTRDATLIRLVSLFFRIAWTRLTASNVAEFLDKGVPQESLLVFLMWNEFYFPLQSFLLSY